MPRVRIAEAAAQELEEAAARYEEEAPGTGERLLNAFENALTLLTDEPYPSLRPPGKPDRLALNDCCFIASHSMSLSSKKMANSL